ncbi:MAG: acyltransferase [Candidatus Peribacteraceae bacterium]
MTLLQRLAKRWVGLRKKPLLCFYSRIWMRLFGCTVPASAKIYGFPNLLRHEGKIIIGERVMMNSLRSIYRFGQPFPRMVLSTTKTGVIEIGDDAGLNGSAIHAEKKVFIGKRVMIGAGCRIADVSFHPVDAVPRRHLEDKEPQEVRIEDDVWLGVDVQVGKGVTIGKGSVIGAKSMVTSDIPPFVLAAGTPAKVIRPLRCPHETDPDDVHANVVP